VFVIMVYFLFERYREKTLAAALYAMLHGNGNGNGNGSVNDEADAGAMPEPPSQAASLFTRREMEIALLLTEGLSQHEIARKFNKTSGEVGEHIKAIREKIGISVDSDPVVSAVIVEYKLTRRETDMLRCLSRKMTNAEIADEMFLSEGTVKTHVHNLLNKFELENRQNIAEWLKAYAKEKRIESPDKAGGSEISNHQPIF